MAKLKGDGFILTAKLGNEIVNCYDGKIDRDTLKKWSKKGILRCPACNEQYSYNHGKIRIPYFKHINSECNLYPEPETDEHLTGKKDIYEWLLKQDNVTDVVLEGWLEDTKQRPDIMFKYCGRQCVIEYQCSPISSEYIDRHNLYQNAGIMDIWICGTKKYIQYYHTGSGEKRVTTLESESNLYYNSDTKQIYKINTGMNNKTFTRYRNNKNIWENENIMRNPFDYKFDKNNFYFIKEPAKSYGGYSKYPSPTGRKSNKYPYPVKHYVYCSNVSIANVMKLDNLKLKYIR